MNLRAATVVFCLLASAACQRDQPKEPPAVTETHQPQHSPEALTLGRVTPRSGAAIEVSSGDFEAEGPIPERNVASGGNRSPALSWTRVEGAGSYVIVVEDPDAPRERPFVHWMIWNIPGNASELPAGLQVAQHPNGPQGPIQGRNDHGDYGWWGPSPPPGHGVHHYHFQVFALDGPLGLHPDADLRTLTQAMQGRILADGELVATYETPAAH
jgi:Raf kinase inhibitor-like YbhB/YbcL family protein